MKNVRKTLSLLLAAVLVIGLVPLTGRQEIYAGEPPTFVTHDADELRALLETDGDFNVTLDGDVSQEFDGLYDREYWCRIGLGKKTFDLAGYTLNIYPRWADGDQRWLLAVTSAETTFTIKDSSADRSGQIIFNAMLPWLTRGWAGTHFSDYYPVHVQHRNIVFVKNGSFIFNGGTLVAGRRKSVYLGYGINANDLQEYLDHGHTASLRYDGDVTSAVNSVGITMESGSVLINSGTIEGRGYREVITGGPENHYYNQYIQGAAIRATGGKLVINDGTIVGHTGAHALDISGSTDVTIRSGHFITNKSGRVAVPHPSNEMFGGENNPYDSMFGGGEYGGHAPLFISPAEGETGVLAKYLDPDMVTVVADGETLPKSHWESFFNIKKRDDVSIVPVKNGNVTLYDSRNGAEIEGRQIAWNGTEYCAVQIPISQYFEDYPWMKSYWVAVAQSTKSDPEGKSPTVYMGDQKISTPDAAKVEKEVGYNSSYPEVQTIIENGSGILSFDLEDLRPDGVADGGSFIIDFIICQNLQPNDTGGYTQYLNCTRTIVVNIEPTLPEVTDQPQSVYAEKTSEPGKTTLTATAEGAKAAVWVEEWPEYKVLDRGIFDESTGTSSLDVDITDGAIYYSCFFYNDYGSVSTDTVSVRYALNTDIVGTNTDVTLYTETKGGTLIVEGDLYSAFMRVSPSNRSVVWHKDGFIINEDSRVHALSGGPHLRIDSPKADDAGEYYATIEIQMNGETYTFETGTYTVTVVEGTAPGAITRIDLNGIGKPHLGDTAPAVSEVTTGDDRYSVDSLRWNGYSSGATVVLSVPESYYEVVFKAADGYHFEYSDHGASFDGIPVYVDGTQVGWADYYSPGSGSDPASVARFSYAYYPVTLTPSTGLDEIVIDVDPGKDVSVELSSAKHFTDLGLIEKDESTVANSFTASLDLPEWATLSSEGAITGKVPSDAGKALFKSTLTYKTNNTGSSQVISSGIVLMITSLPDYLELPEDPSLRWHEHDWSDWTEAEDGTHTRTCKICGGKDAQEHIWDEGEETDGVIVHTCTLCGATCDEPAAEQGHGPLELVDETPATCIAEGAKAHYRCIECGRLFWDEDGIESVMGPEDLIIPMIDHDWGDWTEKDADTHVHVCKACGEEETADHEWDAGKVTKEATTEEEGVFTYTCEICGAEKTESIPKKVTITYDAGEGIKGEDWVDTFDVDCGYKLDAGKLAPPPETFVAAPEGMEFVGMERDGVKYSVGDDVPELIITKDITIKYLWNNLPFEYIVVSEKSTDGTVGKWIKGSGADYEIVIKRSILDEKCFSYFGSLNLEDKTLILDTDYTAKAGSTVLTVKSKTLEKLEAGSYDVTIAFKDGEVKTTLTVEEAAATTEPVTPKPDEAPPTGDHSNVILWTAMLSAAVIAIAGAVFVDRKRKAR